jgi:hypothetical protein
VVRKIRGAHLTTDFGMILLDCCAVADDFRESYHKHAKAFLYGNRTTVEPRVEGIERNTTHIRSSRAIEAIDREKFPRTVGRPGVGWISGIYISGASQYPG